MTQGPDHKVSGEQGDSLFTEYGQFALLLEADISALREPIKDCSPEQKREIISVLEDQINDTYMQGNEELLKKFLYLWMYTIRKLDNDANIDERVDGFSLNFSEWEHDQF